jgi:hypothetical protein
MSNNIKKEKQRDKHRGTQQGWIRRLFIGNLSFNRGLAKSSLVRMYWFSPGSATKKFKLRRLLSQRLCIPVFQADCFLQKCLFPAFASSVPSIGKIGFLKAEENTWFFESV